MKGLTLEGLNWEYTGRFRRFVCAREKGAYVDDIFYAKDAPVNFTDQEGFVSKKMLLAIQAGHFEEVAIQGAQDLPQQPTPVAQTVQNDPNPELLQDEIRKAIGLLDHDNDAHWTAAGFPAIKALEERIKRKGLTRDLVMKAAPGFTRNVTMPLSKGVKNPPMMPQS